MKLKGDNKMPFVVCDAKKDKKEYLENNPDCVKYSEEFTRQYQFKKQLLELRKAQGLTQKDVALKSGLTQQMISRIERMDYTPTLDTLFKYLKALNVNLKLEPIKMKEIL